MTTSRPGSPTGASGRGFESAAAPGPTDLAMGMEMGMQLRWTPTPYRRHKEDEYVDVPGVGRLRIKPCKGGFRLYHDKEPIGPPFPALEAARAAAAHFVRTFGAAREM
jgi:hypothetical protein